MSIGESRPVLRTEALSRQFGSLRAVDGVNFSVQPGECRAIIGPNGAGKTTFFNLLTGELTPTKGLIFFKDEEITNYPPHRRTQLGLGRTFQVSQVFPELSVQENLQLAAQGKNSDKYSIFTAIRSDTRISRKIDVTLDRFHLGNVRSQLAGELSHGRKRQLEVALGWTGDPEILLLDEPAAGLPPEGRDRIFNLLDSLKEDLTVVLIEHDLDLALTLGDRVSCFHRGSILAEDTPQNIQTNKRVRDVYLGTDRSVE